MTQIQKRPPLHPGVILQHHYVEPLSISLTQLGEYLGVTEISVAEILNERAPVTADMALRLSRVFNTTPGMWMNLQKKYDLWYAAHRTTEWQKARPYEVSEMTI
jgi:addiction module HigA family antidote